MIMRGQTPRALSWLGVFTLLVLGLLLLPWLPSWGQAPAPEKRGFNPESVRALTDEIELLANQVDLKKALLRKAEAGRSVARAAMQRAVGTERQRQGVVSEEEIAKARAEIEVAEANVDVARAELREAELKLTQARRRLAELTAVEARRPKETRDEADSALARTNELLRLQAARTKERLALSKDSTDPGNREVSKHLKMIGLALHNYHDVHGSFPPSVIRDADGKPLLSWRVAILPFLGEGDLYREFHLDEPWNSPHNHPLTNRMPKVFSVSGPNYPGSVNSTTLLAPVGPGTLWDGPDGVSMRSVTDGLSNTIAIIQADRLALWSKPEDLEYPRLSDDFARLYDSGFWALFADGSVRHVQPGNPPILHALLTRAGGEVIPSDQIDVSEEPPRDRPTRTRPPYQDPPTSAFQPLGSTRMMGGMAIPGAAKKHDQKRKGEVKKHTPPSIPGMDSMMMPGMGRMMGMPGMGSMMMPGMERMMGMPGKVNPNDSEQIDELKARVDQLREENQRLRRLIRPSGPDAPRVEPTPPEPEAPGGPSSEPPSVETPQDKSPNP